LNEKQQGARICKLRNLPKHHVYSSCIVGIIHVLKYLQ